MIVVSGPDARGAGDVQAEPADEAAPAHRGLRQGPHAQQRPHTRGGATDEVGWIGWVVISIFFLIYQNCQKCMFTKK